MATGTSRRCVIFQRKLKLSLVFTSKHFHVLVNIPLRRCISDHILSPFKYLSFSWGFERLCQTPPCNSIFAYLGRHKIFANCSIFAIRHNTNPPLQNLFWHSQFLLEVCDAQNQVFCNSSKTKNCKKKYFSEIR